MIFQQPSNLILIVIIGVEEEAASLSAEALGLCLAETNPPLSDFPKDRPCTNKGRVLQGPTVCTSRR